MSNLNQTRFRTFMLSRLLKTVFAALKNQKIAILIDLDEPRRIKDFAYLKDTHLTVQQYAFNVFYEGLKNEDIADLGLTGGEMYAYQTTGGSNLDLPDVCFDPSGRELRMEKDVYPQYDILLCLSTYSATGPLTVFAKKYNFRAATMHGINRTIIDSGLSADYDEVDAIAEKLRKAFTRPRSVEIDFDVQGSPCRLTLDLNYQEARKSTGVCRSSVPDVVNLPSGEVYFLPVDTQGHYPMKYDDGTLAVLEVTDGSVTGGRLVTGQQSILDRHLQKIESDPAVGRVGELGIGTQDFPVSGSDIQDEKILGTIHIATGRMDMLGEEGLTPAAFKDAQNATHDDVLFAPQTMAGVRVTEARMLFEEETRVIISDYQPSEYVKSLLA